ncbi:ABC transporter substrate-binding protein [soil metagenome]
MRLRFRAIAGISLATTAILLAGCAPASDLSGGDSGSSTSDDVFKVGVLAHMTGFVAALGTDMQQGWDLYWKQNGTTVGDYTVETVWEDDASDADQSLSKAQLLVEEEKVDVVVGPVLANNSLAVGDYLTQVGVANLSQGGGDDLTQRAASPLVLRAGTFAGSQMTFPAGAYAAEQGYKTAATLCVDYAFGWESCGGFTSAFTDAGGTVTDQLWYPGDATDLSSYVTQLAGLDVDVIFIGSAGGTDSSNFRRSANDFGLLTKTPIINNCCTTDQAILKDVGDIALGSISASYWAEGNDDPAIATFVEEFEAEYGVLPSSYAFGMYATAQLIAAALEASDTKPVGEDLITAVRAVDLSTTLLGDAEFDDYGSIVGPVYIREVTARDDGTLLNTVLKTYPAVSQFWTYDPEEYLANPPFSQDFTGK